MSTFEKYLLNPEKHLIPLFPMKTLYSLPCLLLLTINVFAQCPAGDTFLNSQEDIDNYTSQYSSCTSVTGGIYIDGDGSNITSIGALANLTSIGGMLRIASTSFSDLSGFANLTSVGDLSIDSNPNLTSLNGLQALTNVTNELSILVNDALTDISALGNISGLQGGKIMVADNPLLTDCAIASFCAVSSNFALGSFSGNGTGCSDPSEVQSACEALPVSLTDFRASNEQSTSVLSWKTTLETNFKKFLIERSQTGKNWQTVGMVAGQGSSQYTFTDQFAIFGLNYYRLKMVDKDGRSAYSQIVSVRILSEIAIYPNPVTEKLIFKNVDLDSVQDLRLFNSSGVLVLKNTKIQSSGVDVRKIASGMYTAMLTYTNGTTKSFQLIKN